MPRRSAVAMMPESNIRNVLRSLVEARGISHTELARRLGKDKNWVYRRLSADSPIYADEMPLWAKVLEVSISSIYNAATYTDLYSSPELSISETIVAEMRQRRIEEEVGRPLSSVEVDFTAALLRLLDDYKKTLVPGLADKEDTTAA